MEEHSKMCQTNYKRYHIGAMETKRRPVGWSRAINLNKQDD